MFGLKKRERKNIRERKQRGKWEGNKHEWK